MSTKTANPKNKRASVKPSAKTPLVVREAATLSRNGKPTEEDIRLRAYQKWEAAGRPDSDGVQFWLQAQHELLQMD